MNAEIAVGDVIISDVPRVDLRVLPGQFLLATATAYEPYLPQVVFPFGLEGRSVSSLLLPRALESFARTGELNLRGPFGRGFNLPPNAERALILATDVLAAAHMLPWIKVLVEREREVTLLCGDATLPQEWLPAEVEYRRAADVLAEAATLWQWADALYACGSGDFFDELFSAIAAARGRVQVGWSQVLFRDLPMPCGIGLCYLCAIRGARGLMLLCREGPVLDLADWVRGE